LQQTTTTVDGKTKLSTSQWHKKIKYPLAGFQRVIPRKYQEMK